MGQGGSERPTKKLHLANDEDHGESEIPSRMVSRQASMESSEPCLRDGRAGSSSQIPLKQSRDEGKNPTSSALSRGNHKKDFLIPKTEESTNCVPVSAQPAPMRRPGIFVLPLHDIIIYYKIVKTCSFILILSGLQ